MGRGMGRGRGKKGKKPPKEFPGKYFENLKKIVMDRYCSNCGACVAACPVKGISIVSYSSPPYFPGWESDCTDCGFCVRVCPRWNYQPNKGLGEYFKILAMKSKRFTGQDGGAVTEILAHAMEKNIIDSAVIVRRDENWKPEAIIANSIEELVEGAGTKYSHAFPLSVLKSIKGRGNEKIAVVGTPCVVSATRKLQREMGKFSRKIALVISLFCMENFYYPDLLEFLRKKGIDISSVEKMDIKKGKFYVYPSEVSFPVKDLDEIVPSGCKVCQDFTGIESDISVGSVGSPDGYSTVIVRNKNLFELIETAEAEFGDANIKAVEKLAEFKAKIHPLS